MTGLLHLSRALALALPLLLLSACSSKEAVSEARIDPATASTVTGRVLFTGAVPKAALIDMSANPACERQHPKGAHAEQAVVNPNGTVKNTFVWVKSGLPAAHWTPPSEVAKLDQDGCIYSPHMLGLMTGQTLEISNSDPINHNVHAEARANSAWNESQPPRAEKKFKVFEKSEVLIPVTCNVHPWMRAYLGVSPHPFFAVTAADGTFSLNGLPPGTYILEAVHETFGKKEIQVTVAPRERKTIEFSYAG